MKVIAILSVIVLGMAYQAQAQLHRETIDYKQDTTTLEGYLVYDQAIQGTRPGVIIIHEWNGLGDYVKMRADSLAKLGYIAFGIDIYGKGVRPTTPDSMGKTAGIYRSNRPLMRARAQAGLDEFLKNKMVDPKRIAVIGYCFGGGVALELARSGANIAGVVSFHGNLDTPTPQDAKNIKCRVLAMHGGNDPFVTRDAVNAFWDEMTKAGVDWQLIVYDEAVHGFTNPANGNDPSKGLAYDEKADHRSWEEMRRFFNDIFK
jgi:dienelactone hydrolase